MRTAIILTSVPSEAAGASLSVYFLYISKLARVSTILDLYILGSADKDSLVGIEALRASFKGVHSVRFFLCPVQEQCVSNSLNIKIFSLLWAPFKFEFSLRESYDSVICFDILAGAYLSPRTAGRRILWLGDLQFELTLWRFLESASSLLPIRRFYLLLRVLASYGRQALFYFLICRRFDKVVCCSKSAEGRLRSIRVNASFIPFPYPARKQIGVDMCPSSTRSFLFHGNLLGAGSTSGLEFLIGDVLPAAKREWGAGGFRIVVCGRTELSVTNRERLLNFPEVEMLGFVDDLESIMQECHAMLVPISIPVGNRTRVIDAMSSGLVLVGHSNLSLGNPFLISEVNCLLTRSGRDMVLALDRIFHDSELRAKLSGNARAMYELTYGDNVPHGSILLS